VIRVLAKVGRKINILSNRKKKKKNGRSVITAVTSKEILIWGAAMNK
jgi:hypothetical protein